MDLVEIFHTLKFPIISKTFKKASMLYVVTAFLKNTFKKVE